ncbi:MAG: DUF4185 domain-containing protein [Candidatus Omnitrophota bacterium]
MIKIKKIVVSIKVVLCIGIIFTSQCISSEISDFSSGGKDENVIVKKRKKIVSQSKLKRGWQTQKPNIASRSFSLISKHGIEQFQPKRSTISISDFEIPLLSLDFNLDLSGVDGEEPLVQSGTSLYFGLEANAADLTSESSLIYPSGPDNFNKDTGTLEFWFRPYTWASDGQVIHRLFDVRFECSVESCLNYMLLDVDTYNKRILFKINDAQVPFDMNGGDEKQAVYYFDQITQWQWHHMALTWDTQSGTKMYLDGAKVAENNQQFMFSSPSSGIIFSTSEINPWVGKMSPGAYLDMVNIYGYTKTDEEIFADYTLLKDPKFIFKNDDSLLGFKINGKMLDKLPDHQDANVAGQDGGVSIPYNEKSLWIFGDTLLTNGGFVNNNIALSAQPIENLTLSNASLEYKKDSEKNTLPILLPEKGEDLIWPGQMFNYNGIVYTYYITIKMDEEVWFYALGEGWAKSTAPLTDINKAEFVRTGAYWPAYEKTSITDGPGFPVYDDGKECVYMSNAYYDTAGDAQIKAGSFMTRVKKDEAENLTAHEYWNGEDWVKDKNQKINIFPAPDNENTVSTIGWNAYLGKYLMIHNAGPLVNSITARTADNITGPWSQAKVIVDCDESLNNLFPCYSACWHPEMDKNNGQTIYVTTANWQRYYLYGIELKLEKIDESNNR